MRKFTLSWLAAAGMAAAACLHDRADREPKTAADSAMAVGKGLGGFVGGLTKEAAKQEGRDKANPYAGLRDPCILVSRADAEKYLGPLAADPYRASSEGVPMPDGSTCFYRAASGRGIAIEPSFTGGKIGMKAIRMGGGLAGKVMGDVSGKADTLGADWDDSSWLYGTLNALKGDVMISVDVTAAGGDPVTAAALADVAFKHLDHPLSYDGAAAAKRAPARLVEPRDPCALVTGEEAAAILGGLAGPPRSTGTSCVFRAASGPALRTPLGTLGGGPREIALVVTWTGGFKSLYHAKGSAGVVKGVVDTSKVVQVTCSVDPRTGEQECVQTTVRADTMMNRTDAEMRRTADGRRGMEQMRDVMQFLGAATADSSLQLAHDTAGIQGPWDDAAEILGLSFMAVKKDVLISAGLGLGLEKAKALVAKAMSRI